MHRALTLVVLLVTGAFARAAWTGSLPRPFSGSLGVLLVAVLSKAVGGVSSV